MRGEKYSTFENTWEPEEHISPLLLRYITMQFWRGSLYRISSCWDFLALVVILSFFFSSFEEENSNLSFVYKFDCMAFEIKFNIFTIFASCRYFERPCPPKDLVDLCVDRLRIAVVDALRHKGPEQRVVVEFCHDVYKYLFMKKGKNSNVEKS